MNQYQLTEQGFGSSTPTGEGGQRVASDGFVGDLKLDVLLFGSITGGGCQ
jgi:hypothetical protein